MQRRQQSLLLRSRLVLQLLPLRTAAGDAAALRAALERSRLAAVQEHAAARLLVCGLGGQLRDTQAQLAARDASLAAAEEALKLRGMELEGANMQLNVRHAGMAAQQLGDAPSKRLAGCAVPLACAVWPALQAPSAHA